MKSKFWDILVFSEDGEWSGFRAPWITLRRFFIYFALIMVIAAVSISGWLFSRWQVNRLEAALSQSEMARLSAEVKAKESERGSMQFSGVGKDILNTYSLFPSLDAEDLPSPLLQLSSDSASYENRSRELLIEFELFRKEARGGAALYYWMALLHGSAGILSFPPALASRSGNPILFSRAEVLREVQQSRSVKARFMVGDFMSRVENEALFVSVLVFDKKGSLILRKRYDLDQKSL